MFGSRISGDEILFGSVTFFSRGICSDWNRNQKFIDVITSMGGYTIIQRNGSGVELRTLDYVNPGSNPVLRY